MQDEERPEHEQRLGQRHPQHARQVVDRAGCRRTPQPLVEERVEDAAEHRAPRVPVPPITTITSSDSVKDADTTCGEAPVPSSRRYTTPPTVARNAASTNDISLKRNGGSPITSTRCSFSRIACQTCPGDEASAQRDEHGDDEVAEREPVEVLGVDHADERARELLVREGQTLLAAGEVVRVLLHEHGPRLRERERHHRERDPADAEADRAERRAAATIPTSAVTASACQSDQPQS